VPGLQILVGETKSRRIFVFSADGELLTEMPYSGMLRPLAWLGNGLRQVSLGPAIRDGRGEDVGVLPLEKAVTEAGHRWPMEDPETWGHTMACDVDGDGLEEVIWVSKTCLAVFGNPDPPESPIGVTRDSDYWMRVANTTRY